MGKKIGDYDILETIGAGTYSKVKRAVHVVSGTEFAVKIVPKDRLTGDWNRRQLRRELELTKGLAHPHVSHLVDAMQTSRNVYMVFGLSEGGDLFSKITLTPQRRLSPSLAQEYFSQLLVGLRFCHERHVVHRDLKPENLLLSADHSTLRISDFGFCAYQPPDQSLYALCGSPNTVAPEVLASDDGYDGCKADIWAAGIILYVMIVGRYPFSGHSNEETFQRILDSDLVCPHDTPSDLQDLLGWILTKNPLDRPPISEIQCHPWVADGPSPPELCEIFSPLRRSAFTPVSAGERQDLTAEAVSPCTSVSAFGSCCSVDPLSPGFAA